VDSQPIRLLSLLAFAPLLSATAWDESGNGRCEIRGDFMWRGPCHIERAPPYGVTLGWLPDHRFPFGWSGIFITSKDGRTGRLRVHISFGDDQDLRPVRRSEQDPDCWRRDGLTICARERR
jgi:hypothetical protein